MLNILFKHAKNYPEFLVALGYTMHHEFLHLFFKFVLGRYAYAEVTIEKLCDKMCSELWKDNDWVDSFVHDFWDLGEHYEMNQHANLNAK